MALIINLLIDRLCERKFLYIIDYFHNANYINTILFMFRWNKFWWGGSPIECPSWEELPYDTRKTCDNFMFKHREKCLAEITHLTR